VTLLVLRQLPPEEPLGVLELALRPAPLNLCLRPPEPGLGLVEPPRPQSVVAVAVEDVPAPQVEVMSAHGGHYAPAICAHDPTGGRCEGAYAAGRRTQVWAAVRRAT
jgi:hypothetical protein